MLIKSPSPLLSHLAVSVFIGVPDLQFAAEENLADAAQLEAQVVVEGGGSTCLAESVHLPQRMGRQAESKKTLKSNMLDARGLSVTLRAYLYVLKDG